MSLPIFERYLFNHFGWDTNGDNIIWNVTVNKTMSSNYWILANRYSWHYNTVTSYLAVHFQLNLALPFINGWNRVDWTMRAYLHKIFDYHTVLSINIREKLLYLFYNPVWIYLFSAQPNCILLACHPLFRDISNLWIANSRSWFLLQITQISRIIYYKQIVYVQVILTESWSGSLKLLLFQLSLHHNK